jgi:hypothetical protein
MPPKFIKPFLWSSDFKKIDAQKDKDRIILNLLNVGSKKATDWLFSYYPKKEIKKVFVNRAGKGELNKKSLNYWALVLKVEQKSLIKTRF